MIRRPVRDRLLARIVARATPLDERWLTRPTLVLAPHPDDETLGCGGLIRTLRDRDVPVTVVFMTDGAASHGADVSDLVATRRMEAVTAASVLGVAEDDLEFLPHPDGALAAFEDVATDRIAQVIAERRPGQLVVPHWAEPNSDHSATYRVAAAAARRTAPIEALLVAVWVWDQFPWTNPLSAPRGRHGRRAMAELALRSAVGVRVGSWLTHRLELGECLAVKRRALDAHATQVTRPGDRPDWPILADVANGDWLDLLMQPVELYGTTVLRGSEDP